MKLEFRLLVIDDRGEPDQAVADLERHLEEQGFSLDPTVPDDLSEGRLGALLNALAEGEGKEFDLVIVDYRLEQKYDGPQVLGDFRRSMKFTEMIFYTADSEADLYSEIAKAKIDGVFVARRDELDDVLRGVADIVIGKAVDLNHMRGIAMAEVAEIDVRMGDTLHRAFVGRENSCAQEIEAKIKDSFLRRKAHLAARTRKRVDNGGLRNVVRDGRVFTSYDKWKALRTLARCVLTETQANELDGYDEEVLEPRNKLAHIREEKGKDGKIVLRSDAGAGRETTIDEEWMAKFRQALGKYENSIRAVCGAIDTKFGAMDGPEEPEEL